jgi:abortive infection bacteriophage resistance protein
MIVWFLRNLIAHIWHVHNKQMRLSAMPSARNKSRISERIFIKLCGHLQNVFQAVVQEKNKKFWEKLSAHYP